MLYTLILSLSFGHTVECHKYNKKQTAEIGSGVYTDGSLGMTYRIEPCTPGWEETGTSWNLFTVNSAGSCDTAGKAWLAQHKGNVGVKATYSCTADPP